MLDKFPGFLGYGEIIAIHADWPIYPSGIGWKIALKTLGNFPNNTIFHEVDDIDRCKLLLTQDPQNLTDPFDSNLYHVAVWHEDLVELKNKGFINGVIEKNDFEFEMMRFEKFKKEFGENLKLDDNDNIILYIKDDNGILKETIYHRPQSYEVEDEFNYRNCAVIPNGVSLTESGLNELIKLSNEISLYEELKVLTQPLIKIKRFDTAIRDASLLAETKIKEFHMRPELYGQKLVELHIRDVIKNHNSFNSAVIKCYRGELRTIFKFIRNDFAHNFRVMTEEQCKLILARISDTLVEFNEVVNVYFNKNNT